MNRPGRVPPLELLDNLQMASNHDLVGAGASSRQSRASPRVHAPILCVCGSQAPHSITTEGGARPPREASQISFKALQRRFQSCISNCRAEQDACRFTRPGGGVGRPENRAHLPGRPASVNNQAGQGSERLECASEAHHTLNCGLGCPDKATLWVQARLICGSSIGDPSAPNNLGR